MFLATALVLRCASDLMLVILILFSDLTHQVIGLVIYLIAR